MSADANAYTDAGLLDGREYHYRVFAVNAEISSAYSNEAFATTNLASPSDLSARGMGAASIGLVWSDNSESESGYRIERSQSPGSGFVEINITEADITSFEDNGLTEGGEYYYRIRTTREGVNSDYSNVAGATAGLAEPPEGINTDTLFTFYPNPSKGNIIITIRKKEDHINEWILRLADFSGRVHYTRKIDLSSVVVEENYEIKLPSSIRNGFYSMFLIAGPSRFTEKFVLIR
jgi:hypothetical protein